MFFPNLNFASVFMMIKSPMRSRQAPLALPQRVDGNWFAQQRLRFIEARLFWTGRVNRADLIGTFGVHKSAASKDLTDYQSLAPRNAVYDRSDKAYKAGSRFIPAFDEPTVERLFGHTLVADGLPAKVPLFEWVRPPLRNVEPVVVRNVFEAATDSLGIKIFYRSMTHPAGRWRWIEPHSIAFDGQRWHVRAWCRLHTEFRDFNLGRIGKTGETLPAAQAADADAAWQSFVDVAIRPHRALNADQEMLVSDEYGMQNGRAVIRCREALLGYLLINLGLDRNLSPPRQLIELDDQRILQFAPWLFTSEHALTESD
jgi:hypothetical protein